MRICFCGNAVFGTDKNTKIGYCKSHQFKRTDLDKRSISVKGLEKARKKAGWFDMGKTDFNVDQPISFYCPQGNAVDETLEQWFKDRHKELKGTCSNCGGRTQKGEKNYKSSIAHILPKAYFPSIAKHPSNFVELCFYGNSCHTNMDNKMLDLIDMNCFDEIIERVSIMYPSIAQEERRRIPKILLEYIKTN